MTVYENVRSAVVSKFNRHFNWTSLLNRDRKIERESDRIIDLLSLRDERNVPASELSYGKQRHLELALTDGPRSHSCHAGRAHGGAQLRRDEKRVHLIRQLTEGKTLVMVEHDMEVVFNLADRITVLNNGRILATGPLDEIRDNEEVKKVYLGRK